MDTITHTEAARRLGVHRSTIYRMVEDGSLAPVAVTTKTGRTAPRIPTDQIDALLGATK